MPIGGPLIPESVLLVTMLVLFMLTPKEAGPSDRFMNWLLHMTEWNPSVHTGLYLCSVSPAMVVAVAMAAVAAMQLWWWQWPAE